MLDRATPFDEICGSVHPMAAYTPLSESEVRAQLAELPGWSIADGKLRRSYRFDDFVSAMAFMVQAAFEAERLCHHPNWSNVYNKVEVTLWTHDAGGLTKHDVALARAMEARATQARPG